jgi:hypothetical protein
MFAFPLQNWPGLGQTAANLPAISLAGTIRMNRALGTSQRIRNLKAAFPATEDYASAVESHLPSNGPPAIEFAR